MREKGILRINPLVKRKPIPESATCDYLYCKIKFTPKVAHQKYCRPSHCSLAHQLRQFEKAVNAEVERRMRLQEKNTASGQRRES